MVSIGARSREPVGEPVAKERPRPAGNPVAPPPPVRRAAPADDPLGASLARAVEDRATHVAAGIAPALDARAEAEADGVADRVVAQIGELPGLRPSGDRLPAALSDALAREVGSVEHVRVHADGLSAQLAASIHARAFAAGSDIHLARGEGGAELLAHEAAHAALHLPRAAGTVHAKLMGTYAVLRAKGGTDSTGRGSRMLRRHWIRLLRAVEAYESLEADVVARRVGLQQVKARMLKLLDATAQQAAAWQQAHGGSDRGEQARQAGSRLPSDPGAKAARAQVVAMLLPRLRDERRALLDGSWADTTSLDTKTVSERGRPDRGALNEVVELTFDVGAGETFTGYFKEEKGFNPGVLTHELEAGIGQVDPNYGARAVAMTRLDALFGTNVLARTEFATYNGAMGTVGETAKGTRSDRLRYAITDRERRAARGGGAALVALEDPVLQKGLNQLQILDVICGQLDRHTGNFYIATDNHGRVTKVTGIDLDMAFGKEQKTGSRTERSIAKAHNYIGMPALVDADLAARIRGLAPSDVSAAIDGLLSVEEVDATVQRFTWVKREIAGLARVDEWDADTLERTQGADASAPVTGYIGNLASSLVSDFKAVGRRDIVHAAVEDADERHSAELPRETKAMITSLMNGAAVPLNDLYWQGKLTPAGMRAVVDDALDLLMGDHVLTTIILRVQAEATYMELRKETEDDLKAIFRVAIANHLSAHVGKVKV